MIDKRYLFRGFHPEENGKTTITLNDEKIHGEWLYWNMYGILQKAPIDGHYTVCDGLRVIPETVGQWVTTDKNGNDLFEGDKVKCKHTILRRFETREDASEFRKTRRSYGHELKENTAWGCPMWDIEYWRDYEIVYDPYAMRVKIKNGSDCHYLCSSYISNHDIELIGNKWEVAE